MDAIRSMNPIARYGLAALATAAAGVVVALGVWAVVQLAEHATGLASATVRAITALPAIAGPAFVVAELATVVALVLGGTVISYRRNRSGR
jgi:hypothetical protein